VDSEHCLRCLGAVVERQHGAALGEARYRACRVCRAIRTTSHALTAIGVLDLGQAPIADPRATCGGCGQVLRGRSFPSGEWLGRCDRCAIVEGSSPHAIADADWEASKHREHDRKIRSAIELTQEVARDSAFGAIGQRRTGPGRSGMIAFFPLPRGLPGPATAGLALALTLVLFLPRATLIAMVLDPERVRAGRAIYGLISHAFVHASIAHLLGNVYFLWIFGSEIEARLGGRRLIGLFVPLALWVGCVWTVTHDTTPIVGASGAISGFMGLYVMLCVGTSPGYLVAVAWWLLNQVVMGLLSAGGLIPQTVGYSAHIAGFVGGLSIGLYIRRAERKQMERQLGLER